MKEANQIINWAGIQAPITHDGDNVFFQFAEGRVINQIRMEFKNDICKYVSWVSKGLVAYDNLNFIMSNRKHHDYAEHLLENLDE